MRPRYVILNLWSDEGYLSRAIEEVTRREGQFAGSASFREELPVVSRFTFRSFLVLIGPLAAALLIPCASIRSGARNRTSITGLRIRLPAET